MAYPLRVSQIQFALLSLVTLSACLEPAVISFAAPSQCRVRAATDSATVTAGQTASLNVLANDSTNQGSLVLLGIVTPPLWGSAVINTVSKTISYTAQANFVGSDSLVYRVTNTSNCQTRQATVNLTIVAAGPTAPANQAPVAQNDSASVFSGGSIDIAVLSNDSDPDNDSLQVVSVSAVNIGVRTLQNSGVVTYVAPVVACGTTQMANFNYSIADGRGATATASVSVQVLGRVCPSATPSPSSTPTGPSAQSWCNPQSWPQYGNVVPAAGADVMIDSGQLIRLDCNVSVNTLHVHGILEISPVIVPPTTSGPQLAANSIHVMGAGAVLRAGSAAVPFPRHIVTRITLSSSGLASGTQRTSDNGIDDNGNTRALHVMSGGAIQLYGEVPSVTQTKLDTSLVGGATQVQAGATILPLAQSVNWKAGDRIAIGITDFYGVGQTEERVLAEDALVTNANGRQIRLTQGISSSRWAALQYVGPTGMQLTQPNDLSHMSLNTPHALDQRASVALISRPIVIQGANDSISNAQYYGGHTMVMGLSSSHQVSGVLYERMGQMQRMGRYPIHWHILSYNTLTGAHVGDADSTRHFVRDSVVVNSYNRGITIHGTNGVDASNNLLFNIRGHGVFLEDGSEMHNRIEGNLVMGVRSPEYNRHIKLHDREPSGLWLSNPRNIVRNNTASDIQGVGLWNGFQTSPLGLTRLAKLPAAAASAQSFVAGSDMIPLKLLPLDYSNNTGHSCAAQGMQTGAQVTDNDAGNVGIYKYIPTTGTGNNERWAVFTMRGMKLWKNGFNHWERSSYMHRVGLSDYREFVSSDNDGIDFTGTTEHGGMLQNSLHIGRSLNSSTPMSAANAPRVAWSSYHFAMFMRDITGVNFPATATQVVGGETQFLSAGGMFSGHDLYVHSHSGSYMLAYPGWKLIDAHAGYLAPPPAFDGSNLPNRAWGLTGAVWDPYGYWGPAGRTLVPSHSFYTHGLSLSQITPAPGSGRVSVSQSYAGVGQILAGQAQGHPGGFGRAPLRFERFADISSSVAPNLAQAAVGVHDMGLSSIWVAGFRHSVVANGGVYRVSHPGYASGSLISAGLTNAEATNFRAVVAFPWTHTSAQGFISLGGFDWSTGLVANPSPATNHTRYLTSTTSWSEFVNDSTGSRLYLPGDGHVYVMIQGGHLGSQSAGIAENGFRWGRNPQSWDLNCGSLLGAYSSAVPASVADRLVGLNSTGSSNPSLVRDFLGTLLDLVNPVGNYRLDARSLPYGCVEPSTRYLKITP